MIVGIVVGGLMGHDRKYSFSWELLGDVATGRPHLGDAASIRMYRLMQFCLRDALERRWGADAADEVFRDAGRVAGVEFAAHVLSRHDDLGDFIAELQRVLREMRVGILRVEESDVVTGELVLTLAEDLDCSGLPESGEVVCTWEEGFLAGVFEVHAGRASSSGRSTAGAPASAYAASRPSRCRRERAGRLAARRRRGSRRSRP